MNEKKLQYFREWRAKNRIRWNEYKRNWMFQKRHGGRTVFKGCGFCGRHFYADGKFCSVKCEELSKKYSKDNSEVWVDFLNQHKDF